MIPTLLILIPAMPLIATLVVAGGGRWLKERSHLPIVAALAVSFLLSLALLKEVYSAALYDSPSGTQQHVGYEQTVTLWNWATVSHAYPPGTPGTPDFKIDVVLRADPLTAIMLSMVTFISTLITIYASGYMHGDRSYWRFFSYIGLFVFSMTMLVSVSNFLLLYVFWEAVGLCSYLLVGFWYEKPVAVAAGKKAFLVNRVGDFGFAIGLFLIWCTYGTLDFHDTVVHDPHGATVVQTAGVLGQSRLKATPGTPDGFTGGAVGTAICLLLMLGACGKSAQFPLHVWLPDAMEGPTPVSALIHAATMVTAGVYMVTRCAPLFLSAPGSLHVVALIGGFTALLAALIALTQTDLKRVLAYSTISQLGYMFLSLGTGILPGLVFGMFHLFTHAFFKALLFLGAGSVMHAMGGVIDMRRFGGLRRRLPVTFWTFLFGSLALAGVIPFAGFWSKDGILAAVYERGTEPGTTNLFNISGLSEGLFYRGLFWAGLGTALLTAFYTFRALFMTFFGEERIPSEAGHHAHESPPSMTVPLVILAICAAGVGIVFQSGFTEFVHQTPSLAWQHVPDVAHGSAEGSDVHGFVAALSTVGALAGIGLAAFLYLGSRGQAQALARMLRPLYQLSLGKFFIDQIYNWLVVLPMFLLAAICFLLDRWVIDGLVNLVGWIPAVLGRMLRSLQGGMVQFYALAMILGLLVLIGALVAWPAR